jgi:AraC-like DNA-binding protein
VAEVAERFSVHRGALLSEIGLTETAVEDPSLRVPFSDFVRILERAVRATAEPAFGVFLGLHSRISVHGYLGFAAMTARVLREAIELVVRFLPMQTTALGLRLEVSGTRAALVFEENVPLGSVRESMILAALIGFWKMGNAITGRELTGGAIFDFSRPAFADRTDRIVAAPGPITYDGPDSRLVFGAEHLEWPLVLSDPAAMRLARERCEQELARLGEARSFASRVAARIVDLHGNVRPLPAIARELGLSIRTLKRRLADEGVSYTSLLEERRRLLAVELLSTDRGVGEIAERLGYSDATSFTRAFRRWTGKSPRAFREGRS